LNFFTNSQPAFGSERFFLAAICFIRFWTFRVFQDISQGKTLLGNGNWNK